MKFTIPLAVLRGGKALLIPSLNTSMIYNRYIILKPSDHKLTYYTTPLILERGGVTRETPLILS